LPLSSTCPSCHPLSAPAAAFSNGLAATITSQHCISSKATTTAFTIVAAVVDAMSMLRLIANNLGLAGALLLVS
jgi:hypothetical protein